jgi:hypothetical protein
MILYALHEILPGEEITVDYLNSFDEDVSVCRCCTPSCRQRVDHNAAYSLVRPQNEQSISSPRF